MKLKEASRPFLVFFHNVMKSYIPTGFKRLRIYLKRARTSFNLSVRVVIIKANGSCSFLGMINDFHHSRLKPIVPWIPLVSHYDFTFWYVCVERFGPLGHAVRQPVHWCTRTFLVMNYIHVCFPKKDQWLDVWHNCKTQRFKLVHDRSRHVE